MMILPEVLTGEELDAVRGALGEAAFVDGKLTAGSAIAHLKNNLQLKREGPELLPLDELVLQALTRHRLMQAYGRPRQMTAPIFARYEPGMHYHSHVDAPLSGQGQPVRSDLSMTLFLSDPATYDGGELVLHLDGVGEHAVKLPAGHAVLYPTFLLHRVAPVTKGERLVAVAWAQSRVRDPQMRRVLFELEAVADQLTLDDRDSPTTKLMQKAVNNLNRLIIES